MLFHILVWLLMVHSILSLFYILLTFICGPDQTFSDKSKGLQVDDLKVFTSVLQGPSGLIGTLSNSPSLTPSTSHGSISTTMAPNCPSPTPAFGTSAAPVAVAPHDVSPISLPCRNVGSDSKCVNVTTVYLIALGFQTHVESYLYSYCRPLGVMVHFANNNDYIKIAQLSDHIISAIKILIIKMLCLPNVATLSTETFNLFYMHWDKNPQMVNCTFPKTIQCIETEICRPTSEKK
ncbi:hypothetical protein EI94DRAFT_1705709 [Lactarius quietus]|nr:hypothetical protein EI94DRAFT_1705709 [Lactarius quietus]